MAPRCNTKTTATHDARRNTEERARRCSTKVGGAEGGQDVIVAAAAGNFACWLLSVGQHTTAANCAHTSSLLGGDMSKHPAVARVVREDQGVPLPVAPGGPPPAAAATGAPTNLSSAAASGTSSAAAAVDDDGFPRPTFRPSSLGGGRGHPRAPMGRPPLRDPRGKSRAAAGPDELQFVVVDVVVVVWWRLLLLLHPPLHSPPANINLSTSFLLIYPLTHPPTQSEMHSFSQTNQGLVANAGARAAATGRRIAAGPQPRRARVDAHQLGPVL